MNKKIGGDDVINSPLIFVFKLKALCKLKHVIKTQYLLKKPSF